MERKRATQLEVILKVCERCNLNCPYCYFFYAGNEDYKNHPPFITPEITDAVAGYLCDAVRDLGLETVQIDLHGGEPLLLKKKKFRAVCQTFRSRLDPLCKLQLAVQTNGTLIDDDWIDIFSEQQIAVGVSVDGPAEYNDINRIDHRKRGSHAKVWDGIRKLNEASTQGRISPLGLLCVVNPNFDAVRVYRHFVDDLGVTFMDFLLPDLTHNTFNILDRKRYAKFMCDIYDEWVRTGCKAGIRTFTKMLHGLTAGPNASAGRDVVIRSKQAITISTNGDVGPDDILKVVDRPYFGQSNVATSTLREVLDSDLFVELTNCELTLPTKCGDCCWQAACHGGDVYNRYDRRAGFDNPSVFCSSYQDIYSHIAAHLIASGTCTEERVMASLGLTVTAGDRADSQLAAAG